MNSVVQGSAPGDCPSFLMEPLHEPAIAHMGGHALATSATR
jgi:hypothetical protein